MTIAIEDRKAGPYKGNGVSSTFPFGFKVFQGEELLVIHADPGGAETTLVFGQDYSVALNPDQDASPGGSVALVSPLEVGALLVVTSDVRYLQPVNLTNLGGFYPDVINSALDRLTILTQQNAERLSRSFTAPITGGSSAEDLLRLLEAQLALVSAVHAHLAEIEMVANNEADIVTTAQNVGAVVTVAGDLGGTWESGVAYDFGYVTDPPVGNTSPPGGNIVVVANNIDDVNTVVDNIGDVNFVGQSIADVNLIAGNFPTIQAVNNNEANIDAVADNESDIDAVAASIADVNAVAANIADVGTVAADITDVSAVASIAADVSTVASREDEVVALGGDLTGQPIVIDYGSITNPVSNPAAPSGVLGAVWTNAANIATVAGDIAAVVYVAQNLNAVLDALVGALRPSNNLSDLTDPAVARANLGLADLGGLT